MKTFRNCDLITVREDSWSHMSMNIYATEAVLDIDYGCIEFMQEQFRQRVTTG